MTEDVEEIYQRAGFTGRLELGRVPALLVVDFCRGFTDPACPLGSDVTAAVEATRRLLREARAGVLMTVVFTTICFDDSLKDGAVWIRKAPSLAELRRGSRWVELDPRLERLPDEVVIEKKGASAFFGTPLAATLAAARVDTLLVAGTTTSGCVRASVVDAVQHGYPPFVVRDCVADRAEAPHQANLFDMEAKYAELLSLDQAVRFLQGLRAQDGSRDSS